MEIERPAAENFDAAADVRTFPHGEMRVITIGPVVVGRARFEPGWKWSEHVRAIAGTSWCQVRHVGYIVSGRMAIRMSDGTEAAVGPGDAFVLPAGHDGWVLGEDPCVMLDWAGSSEYGRPG